MDTISETLAPRIQSAMDASVSEMHKTQTDRHLPVPLHADLAISTSLHAFYAAALRAHPQIPDQIRRGRFDTLHTFLRENIYRHGSKYTANELLERVTGGGLSLDPYLAYLRSKYGSLYGLSG